MKSCSAFLAGILFSMFGHAQKIRFASDIKPIVETIEKSNRISVQKDTIYQCDSIGKITPLFSCQYYTDTLGECAKVMFTEIPTNNFKIYYFSNGQLIEVKERSDTGKGETITKHFFTEADFSIGTTYKDYYNDKGILERQRLLADAYKIIQYYRTLAR